MTNDVKTIPASMSAGEMAKRFQGDSHGAHPVVDGDGHCVGMIARGDLLRTGDWTEISPVVDVGVRDIVAVRSADTVSHALESMFEEDVEHLPVIDDGRLVGICTRTDIMRPDVPSWPMKARWRWVARSAKSAPIALTALETQLRIHKVCAAITCQGGMICRVDL